MEWIIIGGIAIAIGVFVYFNFIRKNKKEEEVDITVKPNTTSRPGIKKALLVGINKYRPDLNADLRGCVNDVEMVRYLLVNKFDFEPDNIRVVVDDRATQTNILHRLQWLINDTKEGDLLVFHYSGHGSQVRDRNGDELNDHLDEIICPHDLNWNYPFTDDMLQEIFAKAPKGVKIIMIADCCHSGTIVRELANPRYEKPRFILPPFDIRSRSLNKRLPKRKIMGKTQKEVQRVVLLSGCKDDQTSADAYINGKYNGALSWAVYTTIMNNPNITYKQLHKTVCDLLKKGGFSQEPQLSGPSDLLNAKIFS